MLLKPKIAKQLEAKSRKREWREINPEFCSWFSFQGIMLWFDILGYWNLWKPSWAVFHPHLRGSKALLPLRFHECRNMKTGGGSSNMVMRPFPTSSLQSSFWYKHLLEYSRQKKNQPMLFKTTSFSTRKKKMFSNFFLFIGKMLIKIFSNIQTPHIVTWSCLHLEFHCSRTWKVFKVSPLPHWCLKGKSLQSLKVPSGFEQVEYEVLVQISR